MGSEVARREVLIVSLAAGNKSSVAYEHRVLFVAGEFRGDYLKKVVLNAGKLVAASLPLACGAGSQPGRLSRRKPPISADQSSTAHRCAPCRNSSMTILPF